MLLFFCGCISLSCCKHYPTVGYTKLNHLMDLWFSWLRSLGLSALLAAILFGLLLSFTVISTWLAPVTGQITGCAQNMIWKRGLWFWYWWVALLATAIWGDLSKCSFLRQFGESVKGLMVNRGTICVHLLISWCFLKCISITWVLLKAEAGLLMQDYFIFLKYKSIYIFKHWPSWIPFHLLYIYFCSVQLNNFRFWGVKLIAHPFSIFPTTTAQFSHKIAT